MKFMPKANKSLAIIRASSDDVIQCYLDIAP